MDLDLPVFICVYLWRKFFLRKCLKPLRLNVLQNLAIAIRAVFIEPAHKLRHIQTVLHQKLHRESEIMNAAAPAT